MRARKKISNLLLKNYLISSLIMFFIFLVFFFGTIAMWVTLYFPINMMMSSEDSKLVAENIISKDYKNINIEEILKVNGWIEILDKDLKVVYTKGKAEVKRSQYSRDELNKMLIKMSAQDMFTQEKFIYSIAYDEDKDFYLLVYLPNDKYFNSGIKKAPVFISVRLFFITAILLYIIIFTIIMIIYAKLTSRNLTKPLKELMNGVKSISKGDYSARINVRSKNEFGNLGYAFNLMVEKIEEERKLKEKSEENRRRLIMDISHDLKNPLVSIRGYSNLLVNNHNLDEEERIKYLNIIEKNSIRINDLITDLFELSKFESIDFELSLKKENICEFLRELIAIYIPSMEEKNIEYNFVIPEKAIYANFDYYSLDRAIGNLISNSIRYNPSHTKLNIEVEEFENIVKIVVQDNGIGIPKDLSEDIFNPFVRVDTSRNSRSGGTGLGLTITKTIVEKHGGRVYLESDIHKGCKFTIVLNK
ncbi:HAMP domain-containing histidine kinase [Clostridium sp. MSJ-11]|uniref:histidine kinase n=1 Tax=Clostridium mobile TaxID=2841512 RepID=A0ABS6EHT4_9CLOT|nr:HAMP domain-containing sensor histidine kinase [Clostridium mobile]MBU5484772.1 HAMP domain-containing histidine kinase [Clostridium mobile]